MSLTDLAAIGTLVSGIAVVISLIYLSIQIRQNTRHQRASMQQGRAARTVDMLLRTTDIDIAETILRGRRGDPTLKPEELEQFLRLMTAVFLNFEDGYFLHRAGMLDETSVASDTEALRHHLLPHRGYRAAWAMLRLGMQPDFQNHIEAILRETPIQLPSDRLEMWQRLTTEMAQKA